jgi:hypothetical protein
MVDANPMLRVVPHFLGARFTDLGSNDVSRIRIALVELKFDGIIVLDHAQRSKMGMVLNKPAALCIGMR